MSTLPLKALATVLIPTRRYPLLCIIQKLLICNPRKLGLAMATWGTCLHGYHSLQKVILRQVVFESVVFTLAVSNALQRPRVNDSALTRQFYRDGGMFFTVRCYTR